MKKKIKDMHSGVYNRPYVLFIGTPKQFDSWCDKKQIQKRGEPTASYYGFVLKLGTTDGTTVHFMFINSNDLGRSLTEIIGTIAHESLHLVENMYTTVSSIPLKITEDNDEFIASAIETITMDVCEEVFSYIEKMEKQK